MSIVKMKRLRLLSLTSERDHLLARLQRAGCVEVTEPEEPQSMPEWGSLRRRGFHSASDGEKSSHYGSDRLGECKPIRSSSVRTVHSTGGHPGTGLFPAGNDGRGLGAGGKDQCLEPAAGKAPDPGDQSEELENQFDAVGPAGPSS